MRPLSELRDVDDPAWPQLADTILDSPSTEILPVLQSDGEACLQALQVTARSTLGALALHTGGLLIDGGWLRILGGGSPGLPSLAEANDLSSGGAAGPPALLFVAFDVLGGRFAVNGGGLEGPPADVHYWAPDSLAWESLGVGHTDFVWWSLGEKVAEFYGDLRWDGWAEELSKVRLEQGLSFFPPLCSSESRPIGRTSRRPVPWSELWGFLDELASLPTGPVRFTSE